MSSCAGQETGQPPLPPGHGLGDAAPLRSILPAQSPDALPGLPGDARASPLPKAPSVPTLPSHCPASLVPPSLSQGAGTQHLKWADTMGAEAGLAALALAAAVPWVPRPLRTHSAVTWRGPGWDQAATEPRQDPSAESSLSAGTGTPVPASAAASSHRRTRPLPRAAGGAAPAPAPGEGLILPACSQAPGRSTAWAAPTSHSVSPLRPPWDALPGPVSPPGPSAGAAHGEAAASAPHLRAAAGAAGCAHPGPCAMGVPAVHACPRAVPSPDPLCRQRMLCSPL